MNPEAVETQETNARANASQASVAELRLQLRASQDQARAARAEARRLAREMVLTRRLLTFSFRESALALALAKEEAVPRSSAALLEQPLCYHIDSCQNEGNYTTISGWAFRPHPGWDSQQTTVTLLFHGGATTYYAATIRVARPDIATHYAARGGLASGGACGLEGAGFACKVLHESLPAGLDLDVALRLECAGMACEQSTASRLRL
jgi:hypothetical protein